MGRIEQKFAELNRAGRKAFVAYITAGDPTLDATVRLVHELERNGVDIIELGVPFSDPVADGPVNQEAAMRALRHDVSVGNILDAVREIRRTSSLPIIFFAYLNTLMAYGFEKFAADAAEAGLDGALVLDMPPEESGELKPLMDARGLATVFLVSPVTPDKRIELVATYSTGFIYYVSQMGVTGERSLVAADLESRIGLIKSHADIPVVVGFGISSPEHVRQVAHAADGVVVGSSIVRRIGQHGGEPGFEREIGEYVGTLTAPLRENRPHG